MNTSAWLYNEFHQIGTDFNDPAIVAAYDRKQQSSTVETAKALVTQLGIAKHTVIDLGCGTGTFAIQAALAGATVHAVDVSQLMLAVAQQKAIATGVSDQIQFHHQGFLTYEHCAATADFITTQFALHHLPDFWKMVALLRIAAMLKKDGVFYLKDTIFSFVPTQYQLHITTWIQQANQTAQGWSADDFATHIREEYTTFTWIIERMINEAGFCLDMKNYPSQVIAEYICRR